MSLFQRPKLPFLLPHLLSFPLRFLCISNPSSDNLSSASFDRLIAEAGRCRDFSSIQSLLARRIRAGFFNTTQTFAFVAEDPSSLLPPTLHAISSLPPYFGQKNSFDSLIAHLCKSHLTHLAHQVLDQMPHCLNVVSFYPIISSLSRRKQISEIDATLSSMRHRSITPDATCYNYIICAHCHVRDLASAAEVLTTMLGQGLVPDSLTFDSLVLGACRVGRLDGAVVLLRRMEEDGVKVLYCTYAHVITGLLRVGAYLDAVEFVRAVGGRERRLDAENFGILGRGLLKRKRWEEVRLVLREMEERGLEIEGRLKDLHQTHLPQD